MPEDDDIQAIERREAQSGRVSYSDPVILHETSRRRVIMVPFFIARSAGTELAIKIQTYRKAEVPMDWVVVDEKSVSLDEAASRALLRGLKQHLAVAESAEDGSYLLIRVAEGTAQIGEHDPAAVAAALANVLSQAEVLRHLDQTNLSDELIKAFRGAIRLNEMRVAIAQLRQLLDSGEATELMYQEWCEKHSWAFGNSYVVRDAIREISPGDHLDLLLPTVISGYRDLVELKRPDSRVLLLDETHRDYYFSAEVSRAIGQCHRYLDVLHEVAAQGLRDHPQIVAYHPRAIIVIGRSAGWHLDQLRSLHGLNRRLTDISVMTYDQLLAQGERLIEILSARVADERDEPPELQTLDEEIPF